MRKKKGERGKEEEPEGRKEMTKGGGDGRGERMREDEELEKEISRMRCWW